jgi:hypothetical protein
VSRSGQCPILLVLTSKGVNGHTHAVQERFLVMQPATGRATPWEAWYHKRQRHVSMASETCGIVAVVALRDIWCSGAVLLLPLLLLVLLAVHASCVWHCSRLACAWH